MLERVSNYIAYVPSFGGRWGFAPGSLGPDLTSLSPQEVDLRQALAGEGRLITSHNPMFVP